MPILIPFFAWLAAVQVPSPASPMAAVKAAAILVSIAVGLCTLAGGSYAAGMRGAEIKHVKRNVDADLTRRREEFRQVVGRLERLELSLERARTGAVERRVAAERWQSRMDATIENVVVRLSRIEDQVMRLNQIEPADAREAA